MLSLSSLSRFNEVLLLSWTKHQSGIIFQRSSHYTSTQHCGERTNWTTRCSMYYYCNGNRVSVLGKNQYVTHTKCVRVRERDDKHSKWHDDNSILMARERQTFDA